MALADQSAVPRSFPGIGHVVKADEIVHPRDGAPLAGTAVVRPTGLSSDGEIGRSVACLSNPIFFARLRKRPFLTGTRPGRLEFSLRPFGKTFGGPHMPDHSQPRRSRARVL